MEEALRQIANRMTSEEIARASAEVEKTDAERLDEVILIARNALEALSKAD